MPVFEKDGERVLFVHIPKTAGTAVYLAFVASGWRISHMEVRPGPGTAASLLAERAGLHDIDAGPAMPFWLKVPSQHAPHLVWRRWRDINQSFAIIREPISRFKSSMRYFHERRQRTESIADFTRIYTDRLKRSRLSAWAMMHGHLIPQNRMIGPETRVFRYEENWQSEICRRYGLDADALQRVNVSRPEPLDLDAGQLRVLKRVYRRDFSTLGYG